MGDVRSSADDAAYVAVEAVHAALDVFGALTLGSLSDAGLVAVLAAMERVARRVPSLSHPVLTEISRRGVAHDRGCVDLPTLLVQELHVSPGEARSRVDAARALTPLVGPSGHVDQPLHPVLAQAQAAGEVSAEHVRAAVTVLSRLPDDAPDSVFADVEAQLADAARSGAPRQVSDLGARLLAQLDPSEPARRAAWHRQRREFTLAECPDGMSKGSGYFTPSAAEALRAVLDTLARPLPADDGTPDPRSAGQRNHDALEEMAVRLLARAGDLPEVGGTAAALIITMTHEQFRSREGYASTGHGSLIDVTTALNFCDQAEVTTVVLSATGGVLSYGRERRGFSAGQRRAIAARDGHRCSIPGCSRPASWTQAHHVIAWVDGGRTDVDNGCLLCAFHHRNFQEMGWVCVMLGGTPHWSRPGHPPDRQPTVA